MCIRDRSTVGRFIFNEIIPQDLGFVDRSVEGNELLLEVDFHVGKKQLKKILEKVINVHGATQTAVTLDDIKAIGYKLSLIHIYLSAFFSFLNLAKKPFFFGG